MVSVSIARVTSTLPCRTHLRVPPLRSALAAPKEAVPVLLICSVRDRRWQYCSHNACLLNPPLPFPLVCVLPLTRTFLLVSLNSLMALSDASSVFSKCEFSLEVYHLTFSLSFLWLLSALPTATAKFTMTKIGLFSFLLSPILPASSPSKTMILQWSNQLICSET